MRKFQIFIIACVGFILNSCEYDNFTYEKPTPPVEEPTTVYKTRFRTQVYPLLKVGCATGCHIHSSTYASADTVTAYNAAKAKVSADSIAENSILYTKGHGTTSHSGGDKLSGAAADTVKKWIREGCKY